MRLLQQDDNGKFSLVERLDNDIPRYAILSHTRGAGGDEVTFQDLISNGDTDKPGYRKVRFCAEQAAKDGLRYRTARSDKLDVSLVSEGGEMLRVSVRRFTRF